MTPFQRVIALCLSLALVVNGFAPSPSARHLHESAVSTRASSLHAAPIDMLQGTSTTVAAATLDPTTFLSDILGAFVNSNAILLVPVIAALGLASLVAFAIVAYANPAEPEDD